MNLILSYAKYSNREAILYHYPHHYLNIPYDRIYKSYWIIKNILFICYNLIIYISIISHSLLKKNELL